MSDFTILNEKINWLKKVFEDGQISAESYNNTLKLLEEEIIAKEKLEIEQNLKGLLRKNPSAEVKNGRFLIKLTCPKCKTKGSNDEGKNEFKYIGKDGNGFLYFKCPKCHKDLKYETNTGKVEARSSVLGFLPGKIRRIFG